MQFCCDLLAIGAIITLKALLHPLGYDLDVTLTKK